MDVARSWGVRVLRLAVTAKQWCMQLCHPRDIHPVSPYRHHSGRMLKTATGEDWHTVGS